MAIIKCKMCGDDLVFAPGATVAECESCGSRQTIPLADNEKKLTLFARANRLRFNCEFDKAAGVYEAIVADFPEEAEAYWGLLLCKYGIEYVDDPATGKKIPTCHRSSFDSVLEDSDLEQALENADVVARKLYRDEAKAIETLRRDIIEVSGKEEPYDIFICYKETDADGGRTLDSVLAQDLYDALNEKGYRVFFSRVTLEDKLGQEFEPYIFAALNSAKIMLVVGTDYEYFNAVWVKNEWSRFLQLMTKDKSKHLIPCYKGIDAYDIPKEFAKLQAQDLGKVGAVQDLLRGIEKLLPRAEAQPAPQIIVERAVQSGGPNVQALLKRGNMALEDEEWNKATEFFDQVLNMDAECGEAYLGKALAEQEFCGLEAVQEYFMPEEDALSNARELSAGERDAVTEERILSYAIPGYLERDELESWLSFSFQYLSWAAWREQELAKCLDWFNENRNMQRAEQYATPELKARLTACKAAIRTAYEQALTRAKAADAQQVAQITENYATHLEEVEEDARELRAEAEESREAHYQTAIKVLESGDWQEALWMFNRLAASGYKDAQEKIGQCNQMRDAKAEADAREREAAAQAMKAAAQERERQRLEEERQEQLRQQAAKKKKMTIAAIIAAVLVVAVAVFLVITKVIIPGNHYKAAEQLLASGDYLAASDAFAAMDSYKDSNTRAEECIYLYGESLLASGDLLAASDSFISLGEYEDSVARAKECTYLYGESLLASGDLQAASDVFASLGDYEDSVSRIDECTYRYGESLLASGDQRGALATFVQLDDFKDAAEQASALRTALAEHPTIACGGGHFVGLRSDGTVVAVGYNDDGQCDVSDWRDIVAVAAGSYHTVGLRPDGTVVAVGLNDNGQCDVSGWTDIVAVAAGYSHTVGLRSDGTVVATGDNEVGQCDVSGWTDIVAVAAGSYHTVGLRSDGTVEAVGYNDDGQRYVSGWRDIVAVAAGSGHTVGLRSDGTVVATGDNEYGQCDVSDWTDIVAVAAGDRYTVGLRSDGTVVAVGYNKHGQCDVSEWTDIVVVAAKFSYTVGLRSDGTVVAVGYNKYGQCDVSDWTNIKLPDETP